MTTSVNRGQINTFASVHGQAHFHKQDLRALKKSVCEICMYLPKRSTGHS